jgi:hypothetical protein
VSDVRSAALCGSLGPGGAQGLEKTPPPGKETGRGNASPHRRAGRLHERRGTHRGGSGVGRPSPERVASWAGLKRTLRTMQWIGDRRGYLTIVLLVFPQPRKDHRIGREFKLKTVHSPPPARELDSHGGKYDSHRRKYDSRGGELDSRGWEYESRGWEYESRGWEYESRGGEYESRGWEFDSRGWKYESHRGEYDSHGWKYESRGGEYALRGREYDAHRWDSDARRRKFTFFEIHTHRCTALTM